MKRGLEVIAVQAVDEALEHALVNPLVSIEWSEDEITGKVAAEATDDRDGVVAH